MWAVTKNLFTSWRPPKTTLKKWILSIWRLRKWTNDVKYRPIVEMFQLTWVWWGTETGQIKKHAHFQRVCKFNKSIWILFFLITDYFSQAIGWVLIKPVWSSALKKAKSGFKKMKKFEFHIKMVPDSSVLT